MSTPIHPVPDYRFCPLCAAPLDLKELKIGEPKRPVCPTCDHVVYHGPKLAAGTLFSLDGGLLLARRGISPCKGKWVFPGGFVDWGELVKDAAIRETREEVDVEVSIDSLLDVYSYHSAPVVVIAYAATLLSGTPRAADEDSRGRHLHPLEDPMGRARFFQHPRRSRHLHPPLPEAIESTTEITAPPQRHKEPSLMKRFQSRIVLVTGASRGIGRAIARAYLNEGAKVALVSRDRSRLDDLASEWNRSGRRALAIQCDVSEADQVVSAFDKVEEAWGKLDVVVNNAGISGRTPLSSDSDELWHAIIQTNLSGTFLVSRRATTLMSAGGSIVNMSSVLGRFGVPGYAAYCASKHGVIGLTRAMALELAPRDITVNAICPGWVQTDMAEKGLQETAAVLGISPGEFREQAIEGVPQRRFLEPEEVARLTLFLSSDEARGVTGQAYNLCGGQVMS